MPGSYRLKRSFSKFDRGVMKDVPQVPGNLGILKGGRYLVEVPNRPGYFYVRLRGDLSELTIARNDAVVAPFYDLPVLVSRKINDPTQWYIVGRDAGRYQNWGSVNFLPAHGPQHSFEPTNPGYDITWVYGDQFMPGLGAPSGTEGALTLIMYPTYYYLGSELKYMGYTGTPDMTPYKPVTGSNQSRMVLVYGDPNGNPGIVAGELFSSSVTGAREIIEYIPTISGQGLPAWAVRLDQDTTYIDWDNRVDVRPFFVSPTSGSSSGGGGGGGGGNVSGSVGPNQIAFGDSSTGALTSSYLLDTTQDTATDIAVRIGGPNANRDDNYLLELTHNFYGASGTNRYNLSLFNYGSKTPSIDSFFAWGTDVDPVGLDANDIFRKDWVFTWVTGSFQSGDWRAAGQLEWRALENMTNGARGSKFTIYNMITGTASVVPALQVAGSWAKFNGLLAIAPTHGYYWGDYTVTGSWRQMLSGEDIIWQQNVSGTWTTRITLPPGTYVSDDRVKVTSNDTTAGYLMSKVSGGYGVVLTELNNGGDETLLISSTVSGSMVNVAVSSNDTTPNYLLNKISGGYGILISEANDGGNESVVITNTITGSSSGGGFPDLSIYEVPFAGYSGSIAHNDLFRYFVPGGQGPSLILGAPPSAYDANFGHGLDIVYDGNTRLGWGLGLWASNTWPRIDFTRSNGGFSGSSGGNYVESGNTIGQLSFSGVRQSPAGSALAGSITLVADADFIPTPFAVYGTTWYFRSRIHDQAFLAYPLTLNTREALFDTSISVPVDTWESDGTIADGAYVLLCGNTSPMTLTLPPASGIRGRMYTFKNVSGSVVGVDADGSDLIDGTGTRHLMSQYDVLKIVSDGGDWWVI